MCVIAFRYIDSAVMSVNVIKSLLPGFVITVVIFMCLACTGILICRVKFFTVSWWLWLRYSLLTTRRFFGDVNAHHEMWLGSVHGVVALDFTYSSGCGQMVTEPTNVDREVLGLVLAAVNNRQMFMTRQLGPQIIVPFSEMLC